MPRKVFVSGEILTAADVNTNLMDQAVMTFAGTATRTTAIPSPSEGMVTYLEDSNQVQVYDGSGWGAVGKILQVVSTTKTDTFSTASTSLTDLTGLTLTITPTSTASKVFVLATVATGHSTTANNFFVTIADGSDNNLALADSPGSRTSAFSAQVSPSTSSQIFHGASLLHSPNTTSAFTYKVRVAVTGGTGFVNRSSADTNSAVFSRTVSTITAFEVAG